MAKNDVMILVERETFEKDGNTYFSYFIQGEIRGKHVKASVIPPDKGGYTVLDIVFGNAMACELAVKPFEIKDDATGKVISGNTFAVISYDENGETYECAIKPSRASDKAILNMLIKAANA